MITYATGTVFNEDGGDLDFRIESDTNSNMFVIDGQYKGRMGFGTAVAGNVKYNFGGTIDSYFSGGTLYGIQMAHTVTPASNGNAYGIFMSPTLTESSTGTSALFAGLYVNAPTITTGAATLTEASTVYINGAPTLGSSNYALHIVSGQSLFGGAVTASAGMNMTGDLYVDGFIRSTQYKAFYIDTPSGDKLEHMALEGPEPDVYFRGTSTSNVIDLPDYWEWLVDHETITVQVTPIDFYQQLFVKKIEDNTIYIKNEVKK